jgi:hypothetical protein
LSAKSIVVFASVLHSVFTSTSVVVGLSFISFLWTGVVPRTRANLHRIILVSIDYFQKLSVTIKKKRTPDFSKVRHLMNEHE